MPGDITTMGPKLRASEIETALHTIFQRNDRIGEAMHHMFKPVMDGGT